MWYCEHQRPASAFPTPASTCGSAGEDQDPLQWVNNAREAAEDADVGSGQKRRFRRHVDEAAPANPSDAGEAAIKPPLEQIRPERRREPVTFRS